VPPFVVKRFGPERPAATYVPLFEMLHAHALAPRLAEVKRDSDVWEGTFEFVEGELLTEAADAVPLLTRLALLRPLPLLHLPSHWMQTFDAFAWHDSPAELLCSRLRSDVPSAPSVIAHGDFTPQNIIRTSNGPMLIDWEEAGCAPPEFDAGWLLAVARINDEKTPRLRETLFSLDLNDAALQWSYRAGLLRLLLRSRTRSLPNTARMAMAVRLRELILGEL
jgi:hypothetical protein